MNPLPPTVSEMNQSFCAANNPTISDLLPSGDGILWYANPDDITPLDPTDPLNNNEDYWASSIDSTTGCESISKIQVTVTINDVLPPTTSEIIQTFCGSDIPTVADLSAIGTTIVWYDSESSTTPLDLMDDLINDEDYWAAQTDPITSCESSVRLVINVVLTDPGSPTIDPSNATFCEIDQPSPTLGDLNDNLITSGGTIIWYDDYPNGTILNLNEFLVDGSTYYAVETDGDGCSSVNPSAITVTFKCDPEIYDVEFYDGFSPNNDGRNETFVIKDIRTLYPDYRIEIFNRWGNSIFLGSASTPDWNGELDGNGKQLPAGVYYFVLHFNKDDRKSEQHRLYLSR